jgi:hypothetical protein
MAKLTDSEILARAQSEVTSTIGRWGSEISNERAAALDYYLGEQYGDEVEGRSQVITREVMETVEWILPSLVRIFCDVDSMVAFDPVGPEDEEAASQETDVVNHVFWKQNKGFYNVYTFLKDALLSKTGILKVWWEDKEEEEREEYEGIDPMGLEQLLADPTVEREPIDISQDENGVISVSFKTKRKRGQIRIEPVPPEEFGITRDASSPYAKDARACYHRVKKTKGELIAEGYDRKLVDSLPTSDDVDTPEQIARDRLDDEGMAPVYVRDEYWITECYFYADKNGDGMDELLKVTYAGDPDGGGSATLLDIEEVDRIPFCTASPIILTHKFYGLSIADLTMDLQHIKSTLLRQVLDNTYLANNSRTVVNDEFVNMDDLLTSRPGGVIRVRGEQPVNTYLTPLPHSQLPQETFPLMEYIDQQIKQRTGVGDEVAGLDKNSLANVNTGVAALAYDAARMKIELIARIMAEVGFVPLFKDIHQLLSMYQDQAMVVKLRNKWVQVDPGRWRDRADMTVKVGMGNVSRERRVMGLQQVIQLQQGLAQAGAMGSLINPQNMWMAHKEMMEAMGFQADLFFMDPQTAPPPQPPAPDPQLEVAAMQAQAMMLDAQSKMARAQVDAQKAQAEQQMAQAQIALKARESELKNQISQLEVQLKGMRDKADTDNKVLSMEVEMKRRSTENSLKLLQIQLAEMSKQKDRELDKYKADQDASIELAKMTMQEANDILPGGMLVEDESLRKMFAFGDEEPEAIVEEVITVEPEPEAAVVIDVPIEPPAPAPAEVAMASMVEALVDLQRQLNDLQGREVERVVNRDKNGLIVSITEKRRA